MLTSGNFKPEYTLQCLRAMACFLFIYFLLRMVKCENKILEQIPHSVISRLPISKMLLEMESKVKVSR